MASPPDTDDATDGAITLQLEDARDVQMCFEVERSANLQSVFDKYSSFRGVGLESLQFSYKGTKPTKDTTIKVSLTGLERTKEEVAQACTAGDVARTIDLLSEHSELCDESLTWSDSDGQQLKTPPLFIAIDYGHNELVSRMTEEFHKDTINTLRDGDGDYSPMQWASFAGQLDIVKLLKESGATVDEEALSLAKEHDHNAVAAFLMEHVDLYSCLEGDADAIMEKACREGDAKKVREMLEEGHDIEKWRDEEGKWLAFSPMYLAVKNGHVEVIQLFAERGIQMDLADAPEATAE
ncbi:hypothetical protein ACHAXT_011858 [Thalassiosira profunda]